MRVLIILLAVWGLEAGKPNCPKVNVVVDVGLASGNWYEYQRSDNNLIKNGTCTNVVLHDSDECVCRRAFTNVPISKKSLMAEVVRNRSKFYYQFPLIPEYDLQYEVIDTDYIDFMILMNCDKQKGGKTKFIVLTRNVEPKTGTDSKISSGFKKRGIALPMMVAINNEDCGKF